MSQLPNTSSFADFWLTDELVERHVDKKKPAEFTTDLIQLANFRRVISNYVCILTNKNIAVHFSDDGRDMMNFTDGDAVWLSSSVRRKTDFDWSVGIALHEGAHILLSDFKVVKAAFIRTPLPIPSSLRDAAKKKNITTDQLAYLCKWLFNYVEDRYIDTYIFKEAPGYRGYYSAMYKKMWNSEAISKSLKSKAFRIPNLRSYEYRVINLTNAETVLDALPALRQIAETLDMTNILRLTKTRERLNLAYKIAEVIILSLGKLKKQKNDGTLKRIHDIFEKHFEMTGKPSDKKDGKSSNEKGGDGKSENPKEDEPNGDDPADVDVVINKAVAKEMKKAGKPIDDDEDEFEDIDPDSPGDISDLSKKQIEDIKKDFKKQQDMLKHDYRAIKEHVSKAEKSMLDVIEKNGIILVPTGKSIPKAGGGNFSQPAVDCIVVQKLTRELIESGRSVFPMVAVEKAPGNEFKAPDDNDVAVCKGVALGRLLGKKLQIRGEVNITKYIRKHSGKIERRLLAGIGAGMEDIFNRTVTHKYNKARLHISVDASTSMNSPDKWYPTMTCLTAICVAASMVDNLMVSVSFRCTHRLSDGTELPYVVLAYDSTKDKISKVRQLFPFLTPSGCTPEGLAFESIMDNFIVGKKTDEQDHYFVNISDGEPYYMLRSGNPKYRSGFNYTDAVAVAHTKRQVEKIRAQGVKILSYFINSNQTMMDMWFNSGYLNPTSLSRKDTLRRQFEMMYGRDSVFIDPVDITALAKTLNQRFLDDK
jgi:hypothetical protein